MAPVEMLFVAPFAVVGGFVLKEGLIWALHWYC